MQRNTIPEFRTAVYAIGVGPVAAGALTPASRGKRQCAAMRIALAVVLIAALAPALAKPAKRRATKRAAPVVVVDAVGDRDVARLLAAEFGAPVASIERADPKVRRVCADSLAAHGDRHVAVCTPSQDDIAVRTADLFVLAPPARAGDVASIRASFRGVPLGRDGDVGIAMLGPARPAFVVRGRQRTAALERGVQAFYEEYEGRLRSVLRVATSVRTTATCGSASTPLARRCRSRAIDLRCEPRMGAAAAADGYYPLALQVTGRRGGDTVERLLWIPHDAFGYAVSARVLGSQACGTGD